MTKESIWYSNLEEVDHKYTQYRNIRASHFPPPPEIAAKLHLERWYCTLYYVLYRIVSIDIVILYAYFSRDIARIVYFVCVILTRSMRILPHLQDTGGFFIAVLEKREQVPWMRVVRMPAAASAGDRTCTRAGEPCSPCAVAVAAPEQPAPALDGEPQEGDSALAPSDEEASAPHDNADATSSTKSSDRRLKFD